LEEASCVAAVTSLERRSEMPGIIVHAETGPVLARLTDMLNQINYMKRTGIGTALSDFQTHDMGRDRPFTMRSRGKGTATTVIRQHSLAELERSAAASRLFRRATIRYAKFIASGKKIRRRRPRYAVIAPSGYRKWSTRPILREIMLSKLQERLGKMMEEKLRWEHSRGKARAAHVESAVEHAVEKLVIRQYGALGAAAVQAFRGARGAMRGGGGTTSDGGGE
jgi:hypothetical protein